MCLFKTPSIMMKTVLHDSGSIQYNKVYRALMTFGAVGIPLFGFIYIWLFPNVQEYWIDRIITAGICMLALGISFTSWGKKHITSLVHISAYIITIQNLYIVSLNHFQIQYILTVILSFLVLFLAFQSLWDLTIYLLLVNMGVGVALYVSHDLAFNAEFIYLTFLFFTMIFYTVGYFNISAWRRLELNKKFLEGVINESVDAILLADQYGYIREANANAIKLLGAGSLQDIKNRHIESFMVREFSKEEKRSIQSIINQGNIWRQEEKIKPLKGEPYWGDVAMSYVKSRQKG